jgi:DNA ligase-1
MKPQLLTDYTIQTVTGWIASEKLDGWRMLWTGSQFITRQGLPLSPPPHWLEGMPDHPLDGELFAGRGEFNSIRQRMRDGWHGLAFHVFDVPSPLPFADRAQALEILPLPAHCVKVTHWPIESAKSWTAQGFKIAAAGGEGIIARNPAAPYKAGRDPQIVRFVPYNPAENRKKTATA